MRVDSHHHLWHYNPQEYGWIDDSMQALRRDFLLADLEREGRGYRHCRNGRGTGAAVAGGDTLAAGSRSTILDGMRGHRLGAAYSGEFFEHPRRADAELAAERAAPRGAGGAGWVSRSSPTSTAVSTAMLPSALVYDLLIRTRQYAGGDAVCGSASETDVRSGPHRQTRHCARWIRLVGQGDS